MPTIIRATEAGRGVQHAAFNFDDMAVQADKYLQQVRGEAAKIVAKAKQEADAIRKQAEQQGRQAAMQAVDSMVQKQMSGAVNAMKQAVAQIEHAKQAWLRNWERSAVHVAAAMARKVIRREVKQDPQINAVWLREALELAAGSSQVSVHLHPDDLKNLGAQAAAIAAQLGGLGEVKWIADAEISLGGCRVETRFGAIDQQLEAQLARIEDELSD